MHAGNIRPAMAFRLIPGADLPLLLGCLPLCRLPLCAGLARLQQLIGTGLPQATRQAGGAKEGGPPAGASFSNAGRPVWSRVTLKIVIRSARILEKIRAANGFRARAAS